MSPNGLAQPTRVVSACKVNVSRAPKPFQGTHGGLRENVWLSCLNDPMTVVIKALWAEAPRRPNPSQRITAERLGEEELNRLPGNTALQDVS